MSSEKQADLAPQALGVTRVASFEIWHRQYLDKDGNVVAELPNSVTDPVLIKDLYRQMTLARAFDEKAVSLQRTGRLGTYASLLGEEAVGAGVASAMHDNDVLLPSFREHGAQLQRGATVAELLLYWGGDERGSTYAQAPGDFPNCVPIASHIAHAAGCALAFKVRAEQRVAVAVAGDGATSKGDFYEALNMAGVWHLPLLMVVVNNGWAISVPRTAQTAAKTLAQKAIAVGIPAEQVDGNDVLAVYAAVDEALTQIRAGEGPRLIEALTYRLGDHTTADDAKRYRADEEVSAHWQLEPLTRLRQYLVAQLGWTKDDEQALVQSVAEQVQSGADTYLGTPPQSVASVFESLFESLPPALQAQRDQIMAASRRDGESTSEPHDA